MIRDVVARHADESGIIYCLFRKKTEKVAEKLRSLGMRAAAYHAGLSAEQRDRVQEDFIKDKIEFHNRKIPPKGVSFSDFICIFAMPDEVLLDYYSNTKLSESFDMAKSWATFCC